jgi:hypothetical protein
VSAESLIPQVTGPASALVVCLLIGLAVYKLLRDVFAPMMRSAIDRHLGQVDGMMKMHSEEHQKILEGLNRVAERINCPTQGK